MEVINDIKENKHAFENVYNKAVIYQIIPKDFNILFSYVGSTTNYAMRKYLHKSDCHNNVSPRYNLEVYQQIRSHGGWCNFVMQVIEEYACSSKRELEKREQYFKELYGSGIGKRSFADKCQYYKDHKEEILKQHRDQYANDPTKKKLYYQANKEKILQKAKQAYHDKVKMCAKA